MHVSVWGRGDLSRKLRMSILTLQNDNKITTKWKATCIIIIQDPADWPGKQFSGQSAGSNSNASGTGLVRVHAQGLSSSLDVNFHLNIHAAIILPGNITSFQLVAPGSLKKKHVNSSSRGLENMFVLPSKNNQKLNKFNSCSYVFTFPDGWMPVDTINPAFMPSQY